MLLAILADDRLRLDTAVEDEGLSIVQTFTPRQFTPSSHHHAEHHHAHQT